MLDVRQLRHFVAVAETLHFGRAAERLHMTQPPLSQSIIALERELGKPLFARTKRSVTLTPFGALWLGYVQKALGGIDALPEIARRLGAGEVGRLEVSFVSTADYSILPVLVRRYASLYPEVEIALTEATSDIQIASLLDGNGHVGIIIQPPGAALPESLAHSKLVTEPLVAAVPEVWLDEGRIALRKGTLAPAAVIDGPLILFPRRVAPAFHDLVVDYCISRGGSGRIAQEAIQMQTIISLVSAGMGIALVPASLRNLARTGVRYVDLEGDAPQLDTVMVWRRKDATPVLERFLDVARTAVQPQGAPARREQ